MEFLKFNTLGQWSLHKSLRPVKQPAPFTTARPVVDKPYQVYGGASVNGALHEDHGQKGTLHNFGGGKRPKNAYNKRTAGKPKHSEHSVNSERNPGQGNEEVED